MEDLIANPDAYADDSGMSFSIGANGEIDFSSGGSAGMQRLLKGKGRAEYKELLGTANATQQAVLNYFTSAEAQDDLLKNFLTANPNAKDLPFNNFAGSAFDFANSLREVV